VTFIYDTLHINTINHSEQVILALDSSMIMNGINEPGKWNITTWPNPFAGSLNIGLNMNVETNAEIMIFNTLMQPVRSLFQGRLNKGNNNIVWDKTDEHHNPVAPGVYMISVRTPSGKQILRVISL
jgi:hypothetical protein